ncbi:MAG: cytochrome c oxidase subunit II [Actinobacteria bacterium HGW-Actinobacteria-4]|nr:MAG: cytochrome c oxidase subunit II [Actinobacteria bacterium HGW-Actinobacteria-4]
MSRLKSRTTSRYPVVLAGAAAVALVLSGCSQGIENGALPSTPEITDKTGGIIQLWNGSWIAALSVGVITWGLILWAVVVYRKRKNDNKLPLQTRVHLPLELMYTLIPLIMIGVLFKFTVEGIDDLATAPEDVGNADVNIQVVGKQWSWDFNYLDDDVYSVGVQAILTGEVGVEETLPALYLPVNETVEFTIDTRDVNHSFWIPAFLYKIDAIVGRTNSFQVTPTQTGIYQGKCAELCGEYHASMLFNVHVVERDEYNAYIQSLRDAGNIGAIGLEFSRDQVVQMTTQDEGNE